MLENPLHTSNDFSSLETVAEMDRLFRDLLEEMGDRPDTSAVRKATNQFLSSGVEEKRDAFLPTYVLIETELILLSRVPTQKRRELRDKIRSTYPSLNDVNDFGLIIATEGTQELVIARGFLQELLEIARPQLGVNHQSLVDKAASWVQKMPDASYEDCPFPDIRDRLSSAPSVRDQISVFAHRLYVWFESELGPRSAVPIFDQAYQTHQATFRLLNHAELLAELYPGDGLSVPATGLVNQQRSEVDLLRKAAHYRALSEDRALRIEELEDTLARLNSGTKSAPAEPAPPSPADQLTHIALRSVNQGIIAMDSKGVITLANATVCKIWGYPVEELVGQPLTILMPEEMRNAHSKGLQRFLDTRQPKVIGVPLELEGLRKTGQKFPLSINISVSELAGEPIFIAAVEDITLRKYIEEELVSSKDELETRVSDRTRDLLSTQEALVHRAQELEKTSAELEQFAYVASHDLQEPLRSITSFIQILSRRYGDEMGDEAREYMGFVSEGAKRMQALINELLEYSRIGRINREMDRVDLNKTLEIVQTNLEEQIKEHDVMLKVSELPVLGADSRQMLQLFGNLVDNAIKFRGSEAPNIQISCDDRVRFWEFSIVDNGIGIEDKYRDRIFIIFQRLHIRDHYEGNGIGLAICKKIIERHKGEILLDTSFAGPGTRFVFSIQKGLDKIKPVEA